MTIFTLLLFNIMFESFLLLVNFNFGPLNFQLFNSTLQLLNFYNLAHSLFTN